MNNVTMSLAIASTALYAEPIEKLVILGGGTAGLTSAIYASQAGLEPLVIEGEECEGQLAAVYQIQNFPGFPEGIDGNELVGRMHLQAEQFGARFQAGNVVAVDLTERPFRLTLSDGRDVYAEAVIVAVGSRKRWLGLDAEEALKGKGVSGSARCDGDQFAGKEVVVVGGGDAALEEALYLSHFATRVSIVHLRDQLTASAYLQDQALSNGKIEVILDAAVDDILGVSQDHVTGVMLRNVKTGERHVLPCDGVFVSIGRQPNTDLFEEQLAITTGGLIAVHSPSTETSVAGVFAAGDAIDPSYRKAVVAAGVGCMAALDAIRFLKAHPIEKVFVGELQEKWTLPSDHLPIGISVSDGKDPFTVVSWNVLNSEYMHWIYKNGQGLGHSILIEEDTPIHPDGFTLREQHVIDALLQMIHSSKHLLCLQECSERFIQELKKQLPPSIKLLRSSEEPTKNQNVILYDEQKFQCIEKTLHTDAFLSEPGRPLMEAVLEKEGIRYRIFNAHLRCDSAKSQRFELAQFVRKRQSPSDVTLILGDLNVEQAQMAEALASPGMIPFSPYKTTVSPELHSKAIDHIFIDTASHRIQAEALEADGLLPGLQKSVELLK
jgi:thioredoxin reductase (NADPH)